VAALTEAFDTLPETWAQTEAAAQARAWLSTKEGRCAIAAERARERAGAAALGRQSAERGRSDASTEAYDAAAQRVLASRTASEAHSIVTDAARAASLFWLYVGDVRAGKWPTGSGDVLSDPAIAPLPVTTGSVHYPSGFEAWLRWREAVRRRKTRYLARWHRSKDVELASQRAADSVSVPVADVERVIAELAERAHAEVHSAGVSAVLPTRKGLSIAARLSQLRRSAATRSISVGASLTKSVQRQTDKTEGDGAYSDDFASESDAGKVSTAGAAETISNGGIVSKALINRTLGPALFSLVADKSTARAAQALLGTRTVAKRRIDAAIRGRSAGADAKRILKRLAVSHFEKEWGVRRNCTIYSAFPPFTFGLAGRSTKRFVVPNSDGRSNSDQTMHWMQS
jgi:hypothetical protein